jgi:hypothetical protein
MPSVRRLTAILAADVAGYSRLMGADEEGTHERLKVTWRSLVVSRSCGRATRSDRGSFASAVNFPLPRIWKFFRSRDPLAHMGPFPSAWGNPRARCQPAPEKWGPSARGRDAAGGGDRVSARVPMGSASGSRAGRSVVDARRDVGAIFGADASQLLPQKPNGLADFQLSPWIYWWSQPGSNR